MRPGTYETILIAVNPTMQLHTFSVQYRSDNPPDLSFKPIPHRDEQRFVKSVIKD